MLAFLAVLLQPQLAAADFGISSLAATATNQDGTLDHQAGSHPFAYTIAFSMNLDSEGEPEGSIRDLAVDLPPGLIGNPRLIPRCLNSEFIGEFPRCAPGTQIGVLRANLSGLGEIHAPIFNLAPSPDSVAEFGVNVNGDSIIERLTLQSAGERSFVRLSASNLPGLGIQSISETIWGTPAAAAHDSERGECLSSGGSCPIEAPPTPLLTLPGSCDGPLRTTLTVSSGEEAEPTQTATALSLDAGGNPQGMVACEILPFSPSLTLRPDAQALAPAGLAIDLVVPQFEAASVRPSAALREIVLRLPPGVALNPSGAAGLAACAPAEIGLLTAPGEQPPRFDAEPLRCPGASKLGTVAVRTPLLDRLLSGAIYLATPFQNPSGERFATYFVLEDPPSGTLLKLAGSLEADPATGDLTARVAGLPQLPFAAAELDFHGGPRAILHTPAACGIHSATSDALPYGPSPVHPRASFALSSGPYGAPCPAPESERASTPDLEAGTLHPFAGSSSPLLVRLRREDDEQHLGSFDLKLPPGLLADLSRVTECPDARISTASSRSAAAELADPSCPQGAELGRVRVQTGVGSEPLGLDGSVYLAGPYRGAPASLAAIVPVLGGPFDLGTIVLRIALDLDPRTLRLTARSDHLPQILSGVPLELRTIAIELDRPGFHNPTSCDPMAIDGTAISALGATSSLRERFQVGACSSLSLKPRLAIRFGGSLARNGHPALSVNLAPRASDANLAKASFTLPAGELLDLRHLPALCDPALPPERCPPGSRLGRLRLESPLLESPFEGPIYLRTPSHRLPDLIADLHSGPFQVLLHGHTAAADGRLRVQFSSLPDVPLSRAFFSFAGGRHGIFVNSQPLCARPLSARASFRAHNGRRSHSTPPVKTPGCARGD